MATATIKPTRGRLSWEGELSEDIPIGHAVMIHDDVGVKIKKCASKIGTAETLSRTSYTQIAKINTNKYIAIFRDGLSSNYIYVQVFTFDSSDVITKGTPFLVYSGIGYYLDVCALDTDKFMVLYRGSSNLGYLKAGTVTGVTVDDPMGSTQQISVGTYAYGTMVQVDTDKCIVFYQDGGVGYNGIACVAEASGLTVTKGAGHNFSSTYTYYLGSCSMGASGKAMVGYYAASNGRARCCTISGTAITFGAETIYNAGASYYNTMAEISTDKVVITYRDSGASNKCNAIVANITGVTFGTWGTEKNIVNTTSYYTAICEMDTDKFIIMATIDAAPYQIVVQQCTVSGTTISFSRKSEILTGERSSAIDMLSFSADTYAMIWYESTPALGKTIVVTGELNTLDYCVGILSEGGVTGEIRAIDLLGSITRALSSLTPGDFLYIQSDGTISNVSSIYSIGVSLDSDIVLINKNI